MMEETWEGGRERERERGERGRERACMFCVCVGERKRAAATRRASELIEQ